MNILPFVRAVFLSAALTAIPAFAVNRTVTITAPATVKAGASIQATITATTDAKDTEQIGFFHAEYSADGGKTWKSSNVEKAGRSATREIAFPAGAAGSKALVRVRIAFRGGKSGDVDYTGAAIKWGESWDKWGTPPAKVATITVEK